MAIAVDTTAVVIAAAVAVPRNDSAEGRSCGAKYATATAIAMTATALRTLPKVNSC